MSLDAASSSSRRTGDQDASRYAFIGLGNPGGSYALTRHNIGFRIIDAFLRRLSLQAAPVSPDFHATVAGIGRREVAFLKPMTYMNNSGRAVAEACRRYAIDPACMVVICDDVNLPFGILRLRGKGSAGGHNGLASIIEVLGSDGFARQRVGISPPPDGTDLVEYVLDPFTEAEEMALPAIIDRACEQLSIFVEKGWMMAASRYNG